MYLIKLTFIKQFLYAGPVPSALSILFYVNVHNPMRHESYYLCFTEDRTEI